MHTRHEHTQAENNHAHGDGEMKHAQTRHQHTQAEDNDAHGDGEEDEGRLCWLAFGNRERQHVEQRDKETRKPLNVAKYSNSIMMNR